MGLSTEQARENGKKGGRPKGSLSAEGLHRAKVFLEMKKRIAKDANYLLNAQYSIALGQQFLYKIITYKNGTKSKPEMITAEPIIRMFLSGDLNKKGDTEYYFITTKEPNNYALDSLFDRTFGKSTQHIDHTSDGKALPTPIYGGKSTE